MKVLSGIFGMVLLLALAAAPPDAMQLKMVVVEQSPDEAMIGDYTILVDKMNGINMEFKEGSEHHGIIWSRIKNIAWMVDFTAGTYWTMTEADAAKVKKMRQEIMPKMNAQQQKMKELFEEQMKGKSQEEKNMMRKHAPMGMGSDEEEETAYEKAGSEPVDQWGDADIYVGRRYGEMVEKVWAVGWGQLGVDESYLQVFSDFGEFAGGFMEGEEGGGLFDIAQVEEEQGYPGLAVIKKTYGDDGELGSTEMLKELKTEESDPDIYGLPTTDPPLEETESPFDEMPTGMPGMPPGY